MRVTYPNDISRKQFAMSVPILERARKRTRPQEVDLYEVFCGVLYGLKSGCPLPLLPADFPVWEVCCSYFRQWKHKPSKEHDSLLEEALKTYGWRDQAAQWSDRETQLPHRGRAERQKHGDGGKLVSGIKRHIGVDTQGLPHMLLVTTANVPDRVGALEGFTIHQATLSDVEQVLVDGRDTGEPFATAADNILGATVAFAKRNEPHTFKIIPKRWVVECSFAWLDKCRRLWKNCAR